MGGGDWREHLDFTPDAREWRMLDRVAEGKPAAFDERLGDEVGAAAVRFLCSALDKPVVLVGARIRGRLDLARLRLTHPLTFRHCWFGDGVDLTGATCDEPIEFDDCHLNGLTADGLRACKDISAVRCEIDGASFAGAHLEHDLRLSGSKLNHRPSCAAFHGPDMVIEGGLFLDRVVVTGGVTLDSSYVAADLDCRGGQFRNDSATAIDASWVTVGRELRCDEGFQAYGEVRLCWARADLVSFRNGVLNNPSGLALRADSLHATIGCYLDQRFQATGTVRLVGAQIAGELSASGGTFDGHADAAIVAERLAAKDVYLDRGFRARGAVRLVGAHLERQLTCTGGHFENPSGHALDATGLLCRGSVYLDRDPKLDQGFTAHGQVRLCGASVTEAVACSGGLFECEDGVALDADGLTTEGDVTLNEGFRAIGQVRLTRGTVGRQLDCRGGAFKAPGGVALDLTGLVGHGDVLLTHGFRAVGEVRLRDANVDRDVDLTGAHLTHADETSLDAFGLRARGSLILLPAERPTRTIDLRYAAVNRLQDREVSWPDDGAEWEGFTYQSVDSSLTHRQRIEILNRMRHYSLQPYQQLSKVYRTAGRDRENREVAITGLNQLRRKDNLTRASKVWSHFLGIVVGYGYKLHRPLYVVIPLIIANAFLYHSAEHHDLMEPAGARTDTGPHVDTNHCPDNYPCFNPAAYSVQLMIPLLNLYQVDKWIPDASKAWGTQLLIWTWLMILVGWAAGLAIAAGINASLRKE
ncbi:hypothetical protein K7640_26370 [Micromonospora sp. PLK6-60]|uniref:hypothetical protein n=1 Tax=Micromonospora sp. PLK6-60 TaxID=2873383 RepID=UPI001CA65936|nr:hypothetical protein [Micromonospora sp. PLK6-60]MBY8875365.1 hypothetical protein [Micromonospora sp. PLK6-60]